nr:ADP-ribosylation factor GTPase-activating protein AGD3 [Tanacetum cinerariifolium]
MKLQCDEKEAYEYMMSQQKEKGKLRSGKSETSAGQSYKKPKMSIMKWLDYVYFGCYLHSEYPLKVFIRKAKVHNILGAQHIWKDVDANDKKFVYRLIINFKADVNHVYEQGSCNSSLTLAKMMLLQEQQIMDDHGKYTSLTRDMSEKSSLSVAGTSKGHAHGQGYGKEEFDGCTLHLACETADVGMIELLLQYGANINVFNLKGRHHFIIESSVAKLHVQSCFLQGADPQAKNGTGKTTLELAIESHFKDNEVLILISNLNG